MDVHLVLERLLTLQLCNNSQTKTFYIKSKVFKHTFKKSPEQMLDIMSCSVLWNEMCAHNRNLIFWWVPALQVTLRVIQYSLGEEGSGVWGTSQCSQVSGFQGRFSPKLESNSS